jgi:hypothetical protein
LVGTAGDDHLLGFKGDDRIIPHDGDYSITGGGWAGADHYVSDCQDGTDTITDSIPWGSSPECEGSEFCIPLAVPLDRIVLKGGTQADIEAAVAGVTADNQGDAVIHYGATDIVPAGRCGSRLVPARLRLHRRPTMARHQNARCHPSARRRSRSGRNRGEAPSSQSPPAPA